MRRAPSAIVAMLALPVLAAAASAAFLASRYEASLDIAPRLQWNANSGYCGETSFISAGLFFGQYASQYTVRSLASPGVPQSDPESQLLLGVNDLEAARRLRLEAVAWEPAPRASSEEFLAWVKRRLLLGDAVILGVFTNEWLFYGKTNPRAGDPEYDHIVPVLGIGSDRPFRPKWMSYLATDVIHFSDNGLWTGDGEPVFRFDARFGPFRQTRAGANRKDGPIYSLKKRGRQYGVAVTGVADRDGVTLPVRVVTSANSEIPEMREGANAPPAPMPLELTAVVSIARPNRPHRLYLYDDFADVPDAGFNANAARAMRVWDIPAGSGDSFEVRIRIRSNEVAAFRAVPASAP
jgi:hypothetical protein